MGSAPRKGALQGLSQIRLFSKTIQCAANANIDTAITTEEPLESLRRSPRKLYGGGHRSVARSALQVSPERLEVDRLSLAEVFLGG